MDDSTSLSSLNSADFILINKEQPRLKVAAGKSLFVFFGILFSQFVMFIRILIPV